MRMSSSSSLLARNFEHYNQFGAKPVFRKREKTPQLLINAVTGEVGSSTNMDGKSN
jgi:hypothetical protein